MQLVHQHSTRCVVCGYGTVLTDEAVDRGLVFLAECPRCEHRWTSATPPFGNGPTGNGPTGNRPARSGPALAPVRVRPAARSARVAREAASGA